MTYKLGIDIGSTTIKIAVVSEKDLLFERYRRHHSNIKETLLSLIEEARQELGATAPINCRTMITGSGGLSLAAWVGVPFVQEVIAVSDAIDYYAPETDVAIEIGGEDAKIIYFGQTIEQRMNGICAGGTGSFIDQMAELLNTDASGLNELAKEGQTIYPIAARCGVFAKSDLQPLINEGTSRPDLAVSIFQSIVIQIISGLACGKPIRGNIAFLGGPLHFLSELRERFIDVLGLTSKEIIAPENAHLYAALGSAFRAEKEGFELSMDDLIKNLQREQELPLEIERLSPLFAEEGDYKAFKERHSQYIVPKAELDDYTGDCFLGLDAGSTTTKAVLIGEDGTLLHTFYSNNEGDPVQVARRALTEIYEKLPPTTNIRYSCVTGYGENLLQAAFGIDTGEIETIAHYRAAAFFNPKVDFILDIGGQDMKALRIKDGVIDSILLNEACSAGCGSFLDNFSRSLGLPIEEFASKSLFAESPVDLGSRCTVFMNSRVKQAQKEGAAVADISSGLAYSVIKNALQKVIKITDPTQLGEHIVVQGGTFYNEAVLRAFELISEKEAARPDIAGLMGAFGAAVLAKERAGEESSLLNPEALVSFKVNTSHARCKLCENTCLLTVNQFETAESKEKFISGNRCERPLGKSIEELSAPNLYAEKYARVFDYTPLSEEEAHGTVGLPRVMNMYENYPLWFTFFTELGYRVVPSPRSSRALYEKGIESIPSESECYPAKLAHGHVKALIDQGIDYIFYPSITYEQKTVAGADQSYNCPIIISYPENIKNNMEELTDEDIRFHNPFLNLNDKKSLEARLIEEFPHFPKEKVKIALEKALDEQEKYRRDITAMGDRALARIEKEGFLGIVLAGRPYHTDPEINHGIAEMVASYGIAVLSEDATAHLGEVERPLGVLDQWAYQSRLYASAHWVRTRADIDMVQLISFGCGIDAVTSDEVQEILEAAGKTYTLLKIDEVSSLGSARIRIRSLLATLYERKSQNWTPQEPKPRRTRKVFTKKMRAEHTIITPQMAPLHFDILKEAFNSSGYNLVILPALEKESIATGLRYVNNDACYPALVVVGQILNALNSGEYDLDKVSVVMTQTGGGCRASNYVGFIRKALARANMEHIPVVALSTSGPEDNPGISVGPILINKAVQAIIYGDLLSQMLYRTRPYEIDPGSADRLYEKWNSICKRAVTKGTGFKKNIRGMVKDFENLPLYHITKPKVAVVGEILVKYHPTANNDIITLLEKEDAEVVVPDFLDFFLYGAYNTNFESRYLGGSKSKQFVGNMIISVIEKYRSPVREALANSRRFIPPMPIDELGELAKPIVSLGHMTGEGWFLTAEMAKFIEHGVENIVCVQPFACLPNHVVGKGVIKALHNKYPRANIVAVDYDPGASEVNQLNRIKLMLSAAWRNLEKKVAV